MYFYYAKKSEEGFTHSFDSLFLTFLHFLEGPLAQTGAPYARVPGIRVYGMLCFKRGDAVRRRGKMMYSIFNISAKTKKPTTTSMSQSSVPEFPSVWEELAEKLSDS